MPPTRRTGPPDFVGVGAQRSGTTWWFKSLIAHPGIRPPRARRKELHFFDRFGARPLTDADAAAYHDLFPRKEGQLAGEWTPRYMVDVWTPRLLRRVAPDVKVLVMLRDPIERYRSGVLHRLRYAPEGRREMIAVDALERGRYAWQVRRILDIFGPEQTLILQYERARQDPVAEYRRTLAFLGADDHVPDLRQTRGKPTASQDAELWPDMLRVLQVAYEPDVRALAELVPDLDLGLWPNFAHLRAGVGSS